jgi:ferrous iron transport protein A
LNRAECLCDMEIGERATIRKLLSQDGIRRRLLDIGMIEGTVIECVGQSPCKDPMAYFVRGAVIAIRKKDGCDILIEKQGEREWD